jgi:Fic family protein
VQFNQRQNKMLNFLLKGFEGNLNSMKWAKITKCSKDKAVRDINDLVMKNVLKKLQAVGRGTCFELIL